MAAFGHEIVNAAPALFIPGIPVLHCGIFNISVIQCDQFHHGCVELMFIAHGRRAAFQVTDGCAFFGHEQRALELAGIGCVDAKIRGEFHRALHTFGNEAEGAIAKNGGIESSVKVVGIRDHRAEIFLH